MVERVGGRAAAAAAAACGTGAAAIEGTAAALDSLPYSLKFPHETDSN